MPTKAYRAYSKHGARTADTPRAAAAAHFSSFPKSRKCTITEGIADGIHFEVRYTRGNQPKRWEAITPKTVDTLPATNA